MWKHFLNKLPRKSSSSKHDQANGFCQAHSDTTNAINGGSTSGPRSSASSAKRMSSAVFPSSLVAGIEPLVPFKDVPNSEKQNLFISKISLCCVQFDFSDPNKNLTEKDIKRQALLDLIDYVNLGQCTRFSDPMIASSCKMFAMNLFRVFPPSYRSRPGSNSGEGEEEEPTFDPAWPHLQLVYDLLLKFIGSQSLDSKVGKKYFDHSFILKLLNLFESEDPRERDSLKTVLHRIYGKFMVHRPFIRKAVRNIFYRFVYETDRHNGIAELLEVYGSVVSGFALPLKEEHKIFLSRVLIPMHKPKCVGVYLQQLTYCVTQFVEKEPKLASSVVLGLLRYWPLTNSQKEVMFLSEIEEVLEATDMSEFQKFMVPLFKRIACCLSSYHFQVAERALLIFNNDHVISLIAQNRQTIIPLVFPYIEKNAQDHWNQSVLNLTINVKKMLAEMDEDLFDECNAKFKEEELKRDELENKRILAWKRLESVAAYQPVTGNTAVLVGLN
ncbi:hypothetical protein LUZ60_008168 [Juncus effusus]|nr:hypothetical protein LUZ60_008168 [Juncus effusus]